MAVPVAVRVVMPGNPGLPGWMAPSARVVTVALPVPWVRRVRLEGTGGMVARATTTAVAVVVVVAVTAAR